jgi:uncharacterized protein YjiS (DUF1127 family)
MATFWNSVPHTAAIEQPKLPSLGLGLVGRVFAFIGERRAQMETMRELSRLDERDLHDLSISSYDFNDIARGSFRR